MMRVPTPHSELYAWWRSALAGEKPQITHEPQCGFFVRRLVRGGPLVPARIWMQQETDATGELTATEVLRCEVGGGEKDPIDQWTYLAATPVPESEYRYLMSLRAWVQVHAPQHPVADAQAPVDFNTSPIPF